MTIRAIVHKAEEGGFWAEVPALPGCVTQGETKEELRSNLCEAIELCVLDADSYIRDRAMCGSREKFDRVLSKVPDVEPEDHDRLSPHNAH